MLGDHSSDTDILANYAGRPTPGSIVMMGTPLIPDIRIVRCLPLSNDDTDANSPRAGTSSSTVNDRLDEYFSEYKNVVLN